MNAANNGSTLTALTLRTIRKTWSFTGNPKAESLRLGGKPHEVKARPPVPCEQDYQRTPCFDGFRELVGTVQVPTDDLSRRVVLVFAVDLRLLQLVGIVDINCLPLRVEVDGSNPSLAVSVAGSLGAAEG